MNIGIIIGRIGGLDGVALETEKWIKVLNSMGHKIHVLTGNVEANVPGCSKTVEPILDFHHPHTIEHQEKAFFRPVKEDRSLLKFIDEDTDTIEKMILSWLVKNKIDLLISQNASSIPAHLPMGFAIRNIIESTGIPTICHDHDFYWERGERYVTPSKTLTSKIESNFPPILPNIKHVVINSYCQKQLESKYSESSVIIPNVMDFNESFGKRNRFNSDLPEKLGVNRDDILLFQITRIVERKGIHTAIELIHELNDPRIKLIITGSAKDDPNQDYFKKLKDLVRVLKLGKKVKFAGSKFARSRAPGKLSLSDAYAWSSACTYFSTYEGFGNAFIECILAKKPIFVNNYKPVYWPDIGSLGFETVMIEDGKLDSKSIDKMRQIICSPGLKKEITAHNFELGKKYFSLDVLQEKLVSLIGDTVGDGEKNFQIQNIL